MTIVDAHLDLAYNALRGRDVLKAASQQTPDDDGVPSVGLPDLRAGNVGLICGTIFCEPATWKGRGHGYTTPDEAAALAEKQYNWYEQQIAAGHFRLVRAATELPSDPAPTSATSPLPLVLLLEGADPLRAPDEIPLWFSRGLRIVGLAWKRTRYAGGTGAPGGLTPEGIPIVKALDQAGIIHDVSHLAEESFWQLLDVSSGPVMASHSNCRSICDTEPLDRHLSDDMIRAIAKRGGVIGINFYEKFLLPASQYKQRRATLADVVAHIRRVCELTGGPRHVAIGTDMDGGFGRDQIPQEIADSSHLPLLAGELRKVNFDNDAVEGIMGRNWLEFFARHLP